jgi:CrcB protein
MSPKAARSRRPPSRRPAIIIAVAAGGAVGAVARYALSSAWPTPTGRFPWSTLTINTTGSVALGFLLLLVVRRFPGDHLARPLLATGVIGAYTTFSTFVVEAVLLVRDGKAPVAALYVGASVTIALGALWSGAAAGRAVLWLERWRSEMSLESSGPGESEA